VDLSGADQEGWRDVMIGGEIWKTLHWRDMEGFHGAIASAKVSDSISWCDLRGRANL
jgi:hypothetical protein